MTKTEALLFLLIALQGGVVVWLIRRCRRLANQLTRYDIQLVTHYNYVESVLRHSYSLLKRMDDIERRPRP